MPKLTVVQGTTPSAPVEPAAQDSRVAEPPMTDPTEVLSLLKNYLNISDPAMQTAVADLIAILARTPH